MVFFFIIFLFGIFHVAAFDKRAGSVNQQQSLDRNHADDGRSALEQQLNSANNDRLGDLLDLNSEPAVEDLMRQIMSQAKLWEAIQEANREMVHQKTNSESKSRERFPLTFSAQWAKQEIPVQPANNFQKSNHLTELFEKDPNKQYNKTKK